MREMYLVANIPLILSGTCSTRHAENSNMFGANRESA